jgi:hypothetical protein
MEALNVIKELLSILLAGLNLITKTKEILIKKHKKRKH